MKQAIIILFLIVYVASPIDLFPGPFDDIIVTLLGLAASKKSSSRNSLSD